MKRIFKSSIASLLAICLMAATVVCCCIEPAVMAHVYKAAACSHCPNPSSHDNSSNPAGACRQQLTSAEFTQSQIFSPSVVTRDSFTAPVFFDKHITAFLPSSILGYPRGSPPLAANFTPLYLRTFNLRV